MNPLIKLHKELDALQAESDALLAKTDLTDDEKARRAALPGEIDAKEAEITETKALIDRNAKSKVFLNGASPASVSVAVPQSPTGQALQVADPNSIKLITRARANNFASIPGKSREDARLLAFNLGMWMSATFKGNARAKQYCSEHGLAIEQFNPEATGGQVTNINEDGGFLIPTEIDDALIDLREMYGVFRRRARSVPMGSDQKLRSRRKTGLPAAWLSEGGTIDVSKKGWDQVKLGAKTLGCLAKWSVEFGMDAMIQAGDDLAKEIAWIFAKEEDEAGFVGTGVSTNGGIVGITQKLLDVYTVGGGVGLIVGAGNKFEELTMGNFTDMVGALPEYADTPNVAWYCHRVFYASVMLRLMIAAGGVTAAEIASGQAFKNRTFLGYPVEVSQVFPKTDANSQVPVVFGDLNLSSDFGDRQQTTLAMSEHLYFASNELAIRGTERVDINNHDVGNATDPGPIVGLVTAAS
jgi:HK97 family phage major capsid protein